MALTQLDSSALMQDFEFRGRIKVCVLKYARFILDEAATVPAHNTREKWARDAGNNPDQVSQQMHPLVVMDPAVQTAGKAIDDAGLQAAVENVINQLF